MSAGRQLPVKRSPQLRATDPRLDRDNLEGTRAAAARAEARRAAASTASRIFLAGQEPVQGDFSFGAKRDQEIGDGVIRSWQFTFC
jgi:hypothetical protein